MVMNSARDKFFAWSFLYLLHDSHGTVEFRLGAASASQRDGFIWVEFALEFTDAALRIGTRAKTSEIPRTVGGLKRFIWSANLPNGVPGLYDFRYLNRLFAGREDCACQESEPVGDLGPAKSEKLLQKVEENKRKDISIITKLKQPHWA